MFLIPITLLHLLPRRDGVAFELNCRKSREEIINSSSSSNSTGCALLCGSSGNGFTELLLSSPLGTNKLSSHYIRQTRDETFLFLLLHAVGPLSSRVVLPSNTVLLLLCEITIFLFSFLSGSRKSRGQKWWWWWWRRWWR